MTTRMTVRDSKPETVEYRGCNPIVPTYMVVLVLVGGAVALAVAAWVNYQAHRPSPEQAKRLAECDAAIKQLESLGATVEYETFKGSKYAYRIDLGGTPVIDKDLLSLKAIGPAEIRLYRTEITDAGLTHVLEAGFLSVLDLQGTGITDVGLEGLAAQEHLKWLNLRGTQVTKEGAERLREALPGCEIIW